jgi:hypothetical protein
MVYEKSFFLWMEIFREKNFWVFRLKCQINVDFILFEEKCKKWEIFCGKMHKFNYYERKCRYFGEKILEILLF